MEPEGEKDIKTETSNDNSGNNNANEGRPLSASPGTTSSTGSVKPAVEDQQTLLAVVQFLKKYKLTESADILRREAGLTETEAEDSKGLESLGSGGAATGTAEPESVDANSLLSRVSVSSSTAVPSAAPPTSKGLV